MDEQTSGKQRRNGRGTRPASVLRSDEVALILAATCDRTFTGKRAKATVVLLYRAGLRVNEAVALLPSDLDAERGTIHVRCGKGAKSRICAMDAVAWRVLDRWLSFRAKREIDAAAPVLCTLGGRPMDRRNIWVTLKRLAARAGLTSRVYPHGLRHTHAAELRAEGVDIGVISKQLGHASIATTAIYLDHIAPQAVIDTMRARRW